MLSTWTVTVGDDKTCKVAFWCVTSSIQLSSTKLWGKTSMFRHRRGFIKKNCQRRATLKKEDTLYKLPPGNCMPVF